MARSLSRSPILPPPPHSRPSAGACCCSQERAGGPVSAADALVGSTPVAVTGACVAKNRACGSAQLEHEAQRSPTKALKRTCSRRCRRCHSPAMLW